MTIQWRFAYQIIIKTACCSLFGPHKFQHNIINDGHHRKKKLCVNVTRVDHGLKESWHIRNLSNSIVKEGTHRLFLRQVIFSQTCGGQSVHAQQDTTTIMFTSLSLRTIYACCLIPSVQNCYNRLAI